MKQNVKEQLKKLKEKSLKIQSDPALRHKPSAHDIKTVCENCELLQVEQYKTMVG